MISGARRAWSLGQEVCTPSVTKAISEPCWDAECVTSARHHRVCPIGRKLEFQDGKLTPLELSAGMRKARLPQTDRTGVPDHARENYAVAIGCDHDHAR